MSSVHDLAERVVGLLREQQSMTRLLGAWHRSADGCRVRSFLERGTWRVELDVGTAPLEVFDLPGVDAEDLLAVQLAELELLHDGRPRLARIAPDRSRTDAVFVDRPSSSFAAWFPCDNCDGFRLTMPFSACRFLLEPDSIEGRLELELAREGALVLLARFGGDVCPGCNSSRIRRGEIDLAAEATPMVWLDVIGPEPGWQLWLPLKESDAGVTLPLDLPPWSDPSEVDEAATILAAAGSAKGRPEARLYDWEESDDELA